MKSKKFIKCDLLVVMLAGASFYAQVSFAEQKKYQDRSSYENMLNDEVKGGAINSQERDQRLSNYDTQPKSINEGASSDTIRIHDKDTGYYQDVDVNTSEIVNAGHSSELPSNEKALGQTASEASSEAVGNANQAQSAVAKAEKLKLVPNEKAHSQISFGIKGINKLLATPGAAVTIPGLAMMNTGYTKYLKARESCLSAQVQASSLCMEETSPAIQSTLQNINLVITAAQAVAVKDACSKMSKAMNIAQAGLTLYTASCGAMKKRCDVVCTNAQTALGEIKAGLAKAMTCVPTVPSDTCGVAVSEFEGFRGTLLKGVVDEMGIDGKSITIGQNLKTCGAEYGKLLLSAGLGIISVVKTFKDSQNCAKQSDGLAASASTDVAKTPGKKPIAQKPQYIEVPASTSEVRESIKGRIVASESPKRIKNQKELEAENPYRAYLPGGSKTVAEKKVSGIEEWRKEVTGPHGPTNFNKMSGSYKSHRKSLIED